MNQKPFTILLFCLIATLVAGCGAATGDAETSGAVMVADSADDSSGSRVDTVVSEVDYADVAINFTMPTLTGEELTLDELRGQFVLVNFWATWCVPCREEMPYFQELADEHSGDFVVLGVNLREEAKRIQPFIDEVGITFPILLDPPEELLAKHNVRGLPVSYVVGPDGTIVYRRIGEILPEEFDPWLDEQLLALR